jgi:hypothetical protein
MERQIIKYENVLYLGKDYDGDALTFYLAEGPPLVYVEGYIKLKPDNLMKRHHWIFDPENKTAYDVARFESLKNLGVRERVSALLSQR